MSYPPVSQGGYNAPPRPPGVDFGWIAEAWALFRANPWAWVGAQVLGFGAFILIEFGGMAATGMFATMMRNAGTARPVPPVFGPGYWTLMAVLSVLGYLLVGGYMRMACRQVRGEAITFIDFVMLGDVFGPLIFSWLLVLLVMAVPIGIDVALMIYVPLIGFPLYFLLLLSTMFLVFVPIAAVADRLSPVQALIRSISIVRSNWLMLLGYMIVLSIVSSLGSIACCVGILATYPLYFLGLALAYIRLSEAMFPPTYAVIDPSAWPPTPSGSPYAAPFDASRSNTGPDEGAVDPDQTRGTDQ